MEGPALVENEWLSAASAYRDDLVKLLRDLIAIPAESCDEEKRCRLVEGVYRDLGFDEVFIDELGTVVGRLGNGPKILMMDGHIDTVGVGDRAAWNHDPFEGKLDAGKIWGRGAVDELPGVACMAYGAKVLQDRGLPEDLTLYLTASVMEEHCEGLAHLDLLGRQGLPKPHAVVLGEPTDLEVYRGQRGRLEACITLRGRAAHGAQPDLGENALYHAGKVLADLESLAQDLQDDPFLGKGTLVASDIECATPSRNAVPDLVRIYIDRRLTRGETAEQALDQLRSLPSLGSGEVTVVEFKTETWTGKAVRQEKIYPTWVLDRDHELVQLVTRATEDVLGQTPGSGRWSFSTNGVATMGRLGIPTVGFAPGQEDLAHTTEEWVEVEDLVRATAVYARIAERFARGA